MFNSIVAHLTDLIPSLAHSFAPAFDDQAATRNVDVLTEEAPEAQAEGQDRRQLFVGQWDCTGFKIIGGSELPYNGHMHNLWDLDHTWLVVDFKETEPVQEPAFKEDQYWGFTKETGIHTRPMMTSAPGFALVTSPGWVGDVSSWSGTYDVAGMRFDLTEVITIMGANKFRMRGEMFLKGQSVGVYDVTCSRKKN